MNFGYNRDKEKLKQVNVCLLLGEKSGLPIFQMVYEGSLNDVRTLKMTLATASGLDLKELVLNMEEVGRSNRLRSTSKFKGLGDFPKPFLFSLITPL
jgi:hypothetical protein